MLRSHPTCRTVNFSHSGPVSNIQEVLEVENVWKKCTLSGDYRLFYQWEKDTELPARVIKVSLTRQADTYWDISLLNTSAGNMTLRVK